MYPSFPGLTKEIYYKKGSIPKAQLKFFIQPGEISIFWWHFSGKCFPQVIINMVTKQEMNLIFDLTQLTQQTHCKYSL